MSDIKPPPHSIEAEQSVIGALLRDNDAIDRMGDLRSEHFYLGDHQVIFAELIKQLNAGRSCDVISLMVALDGKINEPGKYLNQMAQNTPSSASIGRYAAIVRDKAVKRGLIGFGRDTADLALNSPEDSGALVDRASSRLEQLAVSRITVEPVRAGDEMAAHIDLLQKREAGGVKAIPTGYEDVDTKLSGGLHRGCLYVVAGRPKMGKTAFVLNIANNVAEEYSVAILSMEMPKSQIHDRNLASLGKIPLQHVVEPKYMTDADWAGLTAATLKIDRLHLYLDDQGGLRLLDVRMKAKGVKRRHGLDLLIIDYLQLMEGDGDNRNAQIEGITRGLKSLSKELDIAVVLLSQLNRKLEERPNKRPQPSDLRDSGAIEQDADAVIFLYRDEVYNPDSIDKGICEVDIALCRQGAPGRVALTYLGEYTRFENCARWVQRAPEDRRKPGNGLSKYL
jgi:replicative DNA helicase